MKESLPPTRLRAPVWLLCGLLLGVFAGLSWTAVGTKSPTYDEPLQALGAWLNLRHDDFRVDFEHPPLWRYLAALPNSTDALKADLTSPTWRSIPDAPMDKWKWRHEMLDQGSGNDADAFVGRSRNMMLLVGVALGGLIAWWSWRLGGAVAAVAATLLYSFDPNFLAHAPLVKNDVAMALVSLAVVYAVWQVGRRLTWGRVGLLMVLCGAGVTTKLSAVVLFPLVALLLAVRAMLPGEWMILGRETRNRGMKLLGAVAVCAAIALCSYVTIWAVYGFRFLPTADPSVRLNMNYLVRLTSYRDLQAQYGRAPTRQEADAWKPDGITRTILAAERHRVLPQAFLAALQFTRRTAHGDTAFLCGQYSFTGWWYYFPLAMLFKTPLATLAAGLLALAVGAVAFRRSVGGVVDPVAVSATPPTERGWSGACLVLPLVVFGGSAMAGNLDLGLRYVLPLYPFLYILIGLAVAWSLARWRTSARAVCLSLAVGLVAESLAAFPDYIPFFNVAVGGSRGGLKLLGDSNLDWGQDLPALAAWQQANPGRRLYLCYFGMADPASYGIQYVNLPGGFAYGPTPELPSAPGVIAISATNLQGIFLTEEYRQTYALLREAQPLAVLGGSIYLFEFPVMRASSRR